MERGVKAAMRATGLFWKGKVDGGFGVGGGIAAVRGLKRPGPTLQWAEGVCNLPMLRA